jgi:hypothetical protein
MPRYAQIDTKTGCVVSDSFLFENVSAENMIAVDENFEIGNKRYVNGRWEEYEPDISEEEPTQLDIIMENQIIIMEALAAQYEENLA